MLARLVRGPRSAPQILLSHGVGDCAAGFADLIAELSPRFRVLALDHRGHGHSPRFDDSQLRHPFAALVGDFVAELEVLDRPLVYGHSMGAAIAAEAAIHRPDLVSGLILEDPAWLTMSDEERSLTGEARAEQVRRELADLPAALHAKVSEEGWSLTEAAAWATGRTQVQTEFLRTGVVTGRSPWREQVGQLAASDTPTLVLTGSGEGAIVGPQGADDINAYPAGAENLRCVLIDGAGHCLRRTHGTEVSRAIAQTLEWHAM